MKRAKFVLAAIAAIAIAGAGLALKANSFSGIDYYTTALPNVAATNHVPDGEIAATGTSVYYTFVSGATPPTSNYRPVVIGD